MVNAEDAKLHVFTLYELKQGIDTTEICSGDVILIQDEETLTFKGGRIVTDEHDL